MSLSAKVRVLSPAFLFVSTMTGWAAGAPQQSTNFTDLGFSRPAISPDGKMLAFVFQSSIWVTPIEGSDARVLVKDSWRRQSPVWSPDGLQIARVANAGVVDGSGLFAVPGLIDMGQDGIEHPRGMGWAGVPGLLLHRELEELSRSGLPPADCLRAATINASKSLGREPELGSIEAGKLADIYLIRRNPLDDPQVLRELPLTIQEGRTVFDKGSMK